MGLAKFHTDQLIFAVTRLQTLQTAFSSTTCDSIALQVEEDTSNTATYLVTLRDAEDKFTFPTTRNAIVRRETSSQEHSFVDNLSRIGARRWVENCRPIASWSGSNFTHDKVKITDKLKKTHPIGREACSTDCSETNVVFLNDGRVQTVEV